MNDKGASPAVDELDRFWSELCSRLRSDEISQAEAERHMEVDAEPLPDALVQDIVAHAVERRRAAEAPPRPRVWYHSLKAAALVFLAVSLLGAGVLVALWNGVDAFGLRGGNPLPADHAQRVITDPSAVGEKRMSAGFVVQSALRKAIRTLRAAAAGDGEPGRRAKAELAAIQRVLEDPSRTGFHLGSEPDLQDLQDRIRDEDLAVAERVAAVETLAAEVVAGLSCLVEARRVGGDPEFLQLIHVSLQRCLAEARGASGRGP